MGKASIGMAAVLLVAQMGAGLGQTIYPLDRAEILAGARFDFKVELPEGVEFANGAAITLNGRSAGEVLGKAPIATPAGGAGAPGALWVRDAVLSTPGRYAVAVRHGGRASEVTWDVFTAPKAKARNVILFIGDGLSNAHRVAARMLSKGIREGRYGGELAIDRMSNMALVSTAGTDSIIPDSANSMSAYMTGHKTCTGAMGVYCSAARGEAEEPRVEPLGLLARRLGGKAVGIVTTTEVWDATPAAVVAQTRSRTNRDQIVATLLAAQPEVILGGGSAQFLPQPAGSRRDGQDYLKRFGAAGYTIVATAGEMAAAAALPATRRLLGLFHPAGMDGVLDRRYLGKGTAARYGEQPDLVDQTKAALRVLERTERGFFLMVESGLIDRFTHGLDWERSVYDTIMLDQAVGVAKAWAAARQDTLIIVVADHSHPLSIIGTYDDRRPGTSVRQKLGVYNAAGFPEYPAPDASGYPARVDPERRLAVGYAAFPDHCEAAQPSLEGPNRPAATDRCDLPGAERRIGNLPRGAVGGVHSGEDVVLTASGPGAEAFHGRIDNTRVFRVIVEALGLAGGR